MDPSRKAVWEAIEKMRRKSLAPVDTMGCDQLYLCDSSPVDKRFQILASLMLSSQTKDEVTAEATRKLFSRAPSATNLSGMMEKDIEELIYPVSFYKRKAIYLKKASELILERHQGDIPQDVEGLCELPGVGPKMAHLTMQAAWGRCQGIAVDVHVHRICKRLAWTEDAKTPEDTRKQLEAWLPREFWPRINHLLVGFGQTVCTARAPDCEECLARRHCPFGKMASREIEEGQCGVGVKINK